MKLKTYLISYQRFNPAEAEEGFRSVNFFKSEPLRLPVSIQPKPKKGLEVRDIELAQVATVGVSIQPKPKKGLEVKHVCTKPHC